MILKKTIGEIDANFRKFRISEALMSAYKLFWDDFSGWYLEIIKPEYQKHIDRATYDTTISFFDELLRIIHPFMPFITEEIWQLIETRKDGESIMVSSLPAGGKFNRDLLKRFDSVRETVSSVRAVRKDRNIPNKDTVSLLIKADKKDFNDEFLPVLIKLCNLSGITFTDNKPEGSVSFMVGTTEFFVPLDGKIDTDAEITRIRSELTYQKGFLSSVMKKLGNDRFVSNAPANIIEMERKKKSDAESKISSLEERLKELENH